MKLTEIPILIGALETIPKGLVKKLEELEIGGWADTIQIVEVGQNTEKSPEDIRRLASRPDCSKRLSADYGVKNSPGLLLLLLLLLLL